MRKFVPLQRLWLALVMVAAISAASVMPALAAPPANEQFERTWARTGKPVADGDVNRTWMWGPEAFTGPLTEDFEEGVGGGRLVQYFDKSRMEINDPNGDPNSPWYVTNGLLVVEMTSGEMHVGLDEDDRATRWPAEVNVAGDSDDPTGPTYATIGKNIEDNLPYSQDMMITEVIDRLGWNALESVAMADELAAYGVTAAEYSPDTGKYTASVFWDFMTSQALVYEGGSLVNDSLFPNPYYATGFPIDQAWWAEVKVAGTYKWVLVQCFERRCLTYTPDNPAGWQIEAGNVGQHYYTWRYEQGGQGPDPDAVPERGMLLDSFIFYVDQFEPLSGEGWDIFVEGNELRIYSELNDYPVFFNSDDTYSDVIVTTDVRFVSDSDLALGCVLTRMTWDVSQYSLCLYADGFVEAAYEHVVDGSWEFEILAEAEPETMSLNPLNEWNNLEIIAKGDQLWFLVNGQVIGHITHSAAGHGGVGVYAYRNFDENPTEVAFRNLSQYEVN